MDLSTETLNHIEQKALEAGGKAIYTDEKGHTFIVGEHVREYKPDNLAQSAIATSTLSSIVQYIDGKVDHRDSLIIHVASPTKVNLLGPLNEYGEREKLMVASPVTDDLVFGHFMDRERMNIMLQAMFVPNDDRAAVLSFIGNITKDNNLNMQDDGVTQSATVKTGVASQGVAKVPNPVTLMPFRTFSEVAQPESDFIFRVDSDTDAALFEADGGAWRQVAINNIKDYFMQELGLDGSNHDSQTIRVLG